MRRDAIRVGIFVVVTVALTAYLAASIVGFEWGRDRYRLAATFDDVAGLRDGDAVKLAGVPVGTVGSVDVVDGRATVSFEVDREVSVPRDSEVSVRWLNLIGQRYLSLLPGESEASLGDGDTVERTRDVVDLGRLVDQLAPLARSISPDHLNRILSALLVAFDGNDAAFDGLLRDVQVVVDTLAGREATVDKMVRDYETVVGALADRDRQIQAMVDNLVAISTTFADNDALLDTALVEVAGFTEGLEELLSRSADDLGGTLESLSVLLGTAADNVTELEAALANLPGMFETLLPAINRGEWLRVAVLCVVVVPGPCPVPASLGQENSGGPP